MARPVKAACHTDRRGRLWVLEKEGLPFVPRRVFYLDVNSDDVLRGGHCHLDTSLLMCAVSGGCEVEVVTANGSELFGLDEPGTWLLVEPEEWHVLRNFRRNTVIMVLASEPYDAGDYTYERPDTV